MSGFRWNSFWESEIPKNTKETTARSEKTSPILHVKGLKFNPTKNPIFWSHFGDLFSLNKPNQFVELRHIHFVQPDITNGKDEIISSFHVEHNPDDDETGFSITPHTYKSIDLQKGFIYEELYELEEYISLVSEIRQANFITIKINDPRDGFVFDKFADVEDDDQTEEVIIRTPVPVFQNGRGNNVRGRGRGRGRRGGSRGRGR